MPIQTTIFFEMVVPQALLFAMESPFIKGLSISRLLDVSKMRRDFLRHLEHVDLLVANDTA